MSVLEVSESHLYTKNAGSKTPALVEAHELEAWLKKTLPRIILLCSNREFLNL